VFPQRVRPLVCKRDFKEEESADTPAPTNRIAASPSGFKSVRQHNNVIRNCRNTFKSYIRKLPQEDKLRTPIFYGSVHLLFYQNNEILLLKRQNTGFEDGKWSLVAGRIDGEEEVVSAAIREAKEEAGVDIEPFEIEVVGVMHRKNRSSEWIDFYLEVKSWKGIITNTEPNKCEELRWFNIRELPENVIPYIRRAIERDYKEMWFESFGW
jgi:8-oxo-dGTP diphosphatase